MDKKIVMRSDCDQVILKSVGHDKFEVVNFKIKPFEDKERDYYKPDCVLEVSAKIQKNISRFRFFLKKFTTDYPALNDLLKEVRASERELLFYGQFVPLLRQGLENFEPDFIAVFFFGRPGRAMIVEDMSLKFFALAKKANPHMLDRFHVSLALKAVAKLHAAFWTYEEKLKDEELSRLFDENDLVSQETVWRKDGDSLGNKTVQSGIRGLKALLKEYKQTDEPEINEQVDELVERTCDILKFQTEYRNVLVHGDLHTKNILFRYENSTQSTAVLFSYLNRMFLV